MEVWAVAGLVDIKQIGEVLGVRPHMLSELRRSFICAW